MFSGSGTTRRQGRPIAWAPSPPKRPTAFFTKASVPVTVTDTPSSSLRRVWASLRAATSPTTSTAGVLACAAFPAISESVPSIRFSSALYPFERMAAGVSGPFPAAIRAWVISPILPSPIKKTRVPSRAARAL